LTGWGPGVASLPAAAARAAAGRRVIPLGSPPTVGERFRRATRECRLAAAAVEAALAEAGLAREAIRGGTTALVYVTAAAYGASNRAFIDAARASAASGTLHFPYTAPSAVPAEVAIEFGLAGGYVILVGGAAAAVEGLWQASLLLARGGYQRALVLAVETFEECADLWARGRWLVRRPLVEAAACAVLDGAAAGGRRRAGGAATALEVRARARAGETLACGPLIALALARAEGGTGALRVSGEWRGRRTVLEWAA
jgi:3-oxoacyl-(acyl-carrier-protein) synthase